MDFLDDDLNRYIHDHTSPENVVLEELNRQTQLKVLQPRMLSGHLQGRVLSMLSKMIKPKNILEIGTYTGYSAICLAEGLAEGGKIDTIDRNEELSPMIIEYLAKAKLTDKINLHIGDAREVIAGLDTNYDLVFIDADKTNYYKYYVAIFDKLQAGGYIIADNVLWSGKVLDDDEAENDPDTAALVHFNNEIQKDDRVENVLFPVRDGLMIIRKRET
jgi:predicted O-methyltransferase YrrM